MMRQCDRWQLSVRTGQPEVICNFPPGAVMKRLKKTWFNPTFAMWSSFFPVLLKRGNEAFPICRRFSLLFDKRDCPCFMFHGMIHQQLPQTSSNLGQHMFFPGNMAWHGNVCAYKVASLTAACSCGFAKSRCQKDLPGRCFTICRPV